MKYNDEFLVPINEGHRIEGLPNGSLSVEHRDGTTKIEVPSSLWRKDLQGWQIPYRLWTKAIWENDVQSSIQRE